jgi:hypothetical protein
MLFIDRILSVSVRVLEQAGQRVIAPELKGMGGDATPLKKVNLATWADQNANL